MGGCNCVTGKAEAEELDDQRIQEISKFKKNNPKYYNYNLKIYSKQNKKQSQAFKKGN